MVNAIPGPFNPLNAELNPICHFLAFLGANHILHVSRIRVKPRGRTPVPIEREPWMGSESQFGGFAEEKSLLPLAGFEYPIVQPITR